MVKAHRLMAIAAAPRGLRAPSRRRASQRRPSQISAERRGGAVGSAAPRQLLAPFLLPPHRWPQDGRSVYSATDLACFSSCVVMRVSGTPEQVLTLQIISSSCRTQGKVVTRARHAVGNGSSSTESTAARRTLTSH
jgi:hypothetical protein